MMKILKKVTAFVVSFVCMFGMIGCAKTAKGTKKYQAMYDIIETWNKQATPGEEREDLFGYGEYLYNSYLLLFPRETPTTLTDFYFRWVAGIDVDGYGAYFTCKLEDADYETFVNGLGDFTITTENGATSLLYDESNFFYPAYIVQWMDLGDKWETFEYILLDEEENTVIFVYGMGLLEDIQFYAKYNVLPKKVNIIPEEKQNVTNEHVYHKKGFTVYNNVYNGLEGATYDISFLDYLS